MPKDPRNPTWLRDVGLRLRAFRHVAGPTVANLAPLAGVGASRWYAWENGERMPDPQALLLLKRDKGLSLDWLYSGEGHMPARLRDRLRTELEALTNRKPD